MDKSSEVVVVTGVSGYVGKWVAIELLKAGYAVRGTLRDMSKSEGVLSSLVRLAGDDAAARVSFAKADLLSDAGWAEAMAGATAVMHVATMVLATEPKDPSLVMAPAIEGTERVLRFAKQAGVNRVIMTSSIATVGYGLGHTKGVRIYTEEDWTKFENMRWSWAYCIGKTMAERSAWTFAEAEGMQLTTIHPGMIVGPAPDADVSVSVGVVPGLLEGSIPALPNNGYSVSDVRDVAEMHVAALKKPESIGQRYLSTAAFMKFAEIAKLLKKAYPAAPVPEKFTPDWLMFILAYFMRDIRQIINDIGNEKRFDGSKGKALLGRDYRTSEETFVDTAESLIELGIMKRPE